MEFDVLKVSDCLDKEKYILTTEVYNELVLFIIDVSNWIGKRNNRDYKVNISLVYELFSAIMEIKQPVTKDEYIMVVLDVIKKITFVSGDFNESFEKVILKNVRKVF